MNPNQTEQGKDLMMLGAMLSRGVAGQIATDAIPTDSECKSRITEFQLPPRLTEDMGVQDDNPNV